MTEPAVPTPEPDTPDTPDVPLPGTEPEAPAEAPEAPETPAELETEDEPATPFQAPETPAEPPAEEATSLRTEKEIEQAFKKLEKVRESVATRVDAILGEDALALVPCPMCVNLAPGFLYPPEVSPLPDEQKAALLALLGFDMPQSYNHHPTYTACPTCDGEGRVETGSKVPGHSVVDCPQCAGKGWASSAPTPIYANN